MIKDYSTVSLVAQLSKYKKVPIFDMGIPPHKILRTGLKSVAILDINVTLIEESVTLFAICCFNITISYNR